MKSVKFLVVTFAVMFIASVPAFAQVFFTATSTLDLIAPNARTGAVGGIGLTALTGGGLGGPLGGETLSVSYGGAQISVIGGAGALQVISVSIDVDGAAGPLPKVTFGLPTPTTTIDAGDFLGYGATSPPAITFTADVDGDGTAETVTVAILPTSLSITVPGTSASALSFTAGGTVEVSGVRLNIVPIAPNCVVGANVNANLSSISGQAQVTNPILPVATIADPIAMLPNGDIATAVRPPQGFTTGAVKTGPTPVQIRVQEVGSFTDSFETISAANPTELRFTITDIPAGIEVDLRPTGTPPAFVIVSPTFTAVWNAAKSSQSAGTATVVFDITGQSSTIAETGAFNFDFRIPSAATIPAGTANITVTLGPEATAAELAAIAVTAPAFSTGIPWAPGPLRYANCPEATNTIVTVVQAVTRLLSSFNVWISGAGGFNTGLALNNTTGNFGAVAQTGNWVVTFRKADGSAAVTLTTSSTAATRPGVGLDTNGNLGPGGTWTVLLSDLLNAAGITGSWSGAIYFVSNFTHAHGVSYIADTNFATQAQGYQMLVLNPSNAARAALVFEALGH